MSQITGYQGPQEPALVAPFANWDPTTQGRRTDQGWDLQTAPDTPVEAAASGRIVYMHDPNGFGQDYPVLMLDTPYRGQTAIYYGHIAPGVPDGTHVTAGQVIGKTLQVPGGNASGQPGWLEIGFWGPNGPVGDGADAKAAFGGASVADTGTSAPPSGYSQAGGTSANAPQPPFDANTNYTQVYGPLTPAEHQWLLTNAGQDVWMLGIPELANILTYVVNNNITDTGEITSLLQQTNFFKTHADTTQAWVQTYAADPAEAQRRIQKARADIVVQVAQMGAQLTAQQISDLAINQNYYGWTPQELTNAISAYVPSAQNINPVQGQAGVNFQSIKALATQTWGVPTSDTQINTWVQQMLTGQQTQQQIEALLKSQAMSMYPTLAEQFTRGFTFAQATDPYKQIAQQYLGVPADQINFTDPKWMAAVSSIDPKTGQRTEMGMDAWTNYIRSNPQYGFGQTTMAKNQAYDTAAQLATLLGKVAP